MKILSKFIFILLLASITSCAIPTSRITNKHLSNWNARNLPQLFKNQERIVGALTVNEAIARSLRYNLQRRVASIEEQLALAEAGVTVYDMFPSIVLGGRLEGRNNPPLYDSKDAETGSVSSATSYSSSIYPLKIDIDAQATWNLLDFGVSLIRSLQATDRARISSERRRKAIQEIVNEVQIAFWQAAAAQRLSKDVERLLPRVDEATALRKREETSGARPPLESLAEQRTLLELKRQLLAIHNTLINSKVTLANLIGFRPGTDFKLNITVGAGVTNLNIGIEALERFGLNNRPEMIEEAYAERIAENDVKAAIMSLLPSVSGGGGYNFSFDPLTVNKQWINYGAQVTYNLLNLARGIGSITTSNLRVNLVRQRRLAVAMSVLTQVRLSWLNYWQAREQYQAAVDFANVENRILQRVQALAQTGSVGELELIRAFMNALIGELNKDLAFADMRASLNRVLISIGTDPTPDAVSATDIKTISFEVARHQENWQQDLLARIFVQDSAIAQSLAEEYTNDTTAKGDKIEDHKIFISSIDTNSETKIDKPSPEIAELLTTQDPVFSWSTKPAVEIVPSQKLSSSHISNIIGTTINNPSF